jgi:hypothetical protein
VHAVICLVLSAGVLASACSTAEPLPTTRPTAVERLRLEAGDYVHVAWPDEDTIVLGWYPPLGSGGESNGSAMVRATLSSRQHEVLEEPETAPGCSVIYDLRPQSVPDGRFTFVRDCLTDGPSDHHEIRLGGTDTTDEEVLAAVHDIWLVDGRANLYSVTLDPTLTAGFVGIGGVICDTVARLDATGIHPFTFRHVHGSDVGDAFVTPCSETMNVREPNLTPDGRELAVLVSPDTLGRDGWDRLDAAYDVQVIDLESGSSRVLVEHLPAPNRMVLSPDGSTLGVVGDVGVGVARYVMLVPMDGGEPSRLDVDLDGPIEDIAWSPDSTALVALVRTTPLDALDRRAIPVLIELRDGQPRPSPDGGNEARPARVPRASPRVRG